MEIEELQSAWQQMSHELENQKKLTDEIILKMTQYTYRNKFTKLANYETVGAIFCYILSVLIFINFHKLDTSFLQLSGIITQLFLIIFPTLTLKSLYGIQKLNIITGSYKDNLKNYLKRKNNLLKLQQIGIFTSIILTTMAFPVALKLVSDKNIHEIELKPQIFIAMLVITIAMIWVCTWGYKCYKKATASAEHVLKDLE